MAESRNGVYVWITWLSKVMAGEQSCEWASWFKAHMTYTKLPNDFDITAWTIEHTKRLRELRLERQKAGDEVFVEGENSIKYVSPKGITVAGKPDLIALSGKAATVYDVKTGQPKTSDTIQVMIYMYLVPLTIQKYRGVALTGHVVYKDNRVNIPSKAIDAKFKEQFAYFLDIVGGLDEPEKVSGPSECRFCDIPKSECSERYEVPANAKSGATGNAERG